ncbi:hypothetical protein V1525DRAFT_449274 [Lipomyces kononenkoae]|uniref:Uncharacterized protein n=1 Tax=Lipomyces kononenkoae TaxID=34357 RepID=A0ACC3T5T1_LIPKO
MSVISRYLSTTFVISGNVLTVILFAVVLSSLPTGSSIHMGETRLLSVESHYTHSPVLDKLGKGLFTPTPPRIASHHTDGTNVTETPVKSSTRRRRNNAHNFETTPATTSHMKTKKPPTHQSPQWQQEPIQTAPATPIRHSSDPSRYAGPTFHSSPAPNNIPVPRFASTSAPTGSSVEHYFSARKSMESDNSSSVSASAGTSLDSTTPSPASSPGASHTTVQAEIIVNRVEDTATGSTKVENARISRFGDSVVFKPRRKGLASVSANLERVSNTPSTPENNAIDLSGANTQQRQAPAEFDFLFKSSNEPVPSSQRRAPREFDFLFKQTVTAMSK